ncbi:MAG: FtsK/SpoIIIE domain-containing protein [Rubripirellula sp.]
MKDSSVGPVGLFDNRRQQRLLDGLSQRFRSCVEQQEHLQLQHAEELKNESEQLTGMVAETTAECRLQRREMLAQWDRAEEELNSGYESTIIKTRQELNRLAAIFRRKAEEEKATINHKVQSRRQAVLEQYDNRKNQPGKQQQKEHREIDESLRPIHEHLEWGRELTIRRLDRLPDVDLNESPGKSMPSHPPESVKESIEMIGRLTRECEKTVNEMQSGAASKIVDSFYLPGGVAIFVFIWAIVAFFVAPRPPWLWMAAGIIPAGFLGFSIYLILLWPLKRMTRRLYPQVEQLFHAAEKCAAAGREISSQEAAELSADLIARRDAHIDATKRWKLEQVQELETNLKAEQEKARESLLLTLETADESYSKDAADMDQRMRSQADKVAERIKQKIADTDQRSQSHREATAERRHKHLQRLAVRLQDGIRRGLHQIEVCQQRADIRFPDWSDVRGGETPTGNLDFLPLGWLKVDERLHSLLRPPALASASADEADQREAVQESDGILMDLPIPERMPVGLHRRLHSGVVIRAHQAQMNQAIELAHQVLWRALTGAEPSRTKLTLIDPLGRGQHFTSFMALADHDPSLVGHRVWTTDSKIDERLGELSHHVEDVLQSSLRDRFERIEDYNELAGTMAEPYRVVAAVGFPEGLSRESYRHLKALLQSGLRCGIFTVLVCDEAKPWPADMPLPTGDKIVPLCLNEKGEWHLDLEGLRELPFVPAPAPPSSLRSELIEQIGRAAISASKVEIPLQAILSADGEGNGNTDDGLEIVVGSQGANRSLCLQLGEGVRQHVLIAGKTGSGKSTLLHSIITSGAHHYRPDQLQFYLLDFKKGVEFKPYADFAIPHARVIGIESEREFGRSVLQRLDAELQQRGELFRSAGVQELGDYRAATGKTLPRIMLVVDEFQELFVRDDRLAGDCTMLLDRLVRQGRSFGMHVILSSQSLAGAYSLPRATLGQMAVRIAMQCSESDAALILSDDNTAARLISRPGEAIYNDAGGLVEGNQPFQVAWLSSSEHREMLSAIAARDESFAADLSPPVVFEGNRPCRWTSSLAGAAMSDDQRFVGLLGESVELGPPIGLELSRNNGRNVLMIAPPDSRSALIASAVTGLAKSDPRLEVLYFDGNRVDDGPSTAPWLETAGVKLQAIKPRDCEQEMRRLAELITGRGDESEGTAPILLVIDPLERFRDLRQDDSFNFSLDASSRQLSGAAAFQQVLRDGPAAGVFVLLICGSAETLSRWLPRASQHDLELRILGQMNQSDSALLIDSPIASDLSAATMLLYDDSDGRISKFRQTDLPDAGAVAKWLT